MSWITESNRMKHFLYAIPCAFLLGIAFVLGLALGMEFKDYRFNELVAWLEKQGKQKPCMIQWKGDNLKEVIGFTGKDKNFEKWFKSFEEYERYVHEHNDIFKLFNENGSHYEIPVGAWIVKTPDGYNIASNAVLKQKSINERAWLYLVSDVLTWKDGIGQYLDDPRVQELAKRLCNDYAQKLYRIEKKL